MNTISKYQGKSLTRKQRNRHKRLLRRIEVYRQITLLVMEELRDVDLDIVEMFTETMEEASDLLYKRHGYITSDMQEEFEKFTNEYSQAMLEIMRSHNQRVLHELERQGHRLERIDPDWRLLLPAFSDSE